ncbi:MAG: cytochrome c [Bacteroidota bacterium]
MKKIIFIFSFFFLATSCTKEKAVAAIITADCPDTIKFSTQISPMITTYCTGCHTSGGSASPVFTSYSSIETHASTMLKYMKADGVQLMPQGGPALNDSLIQQFTCWINQGKQNN